MVVTLKREIHDMEHGDYRGRRVLVTGATGFIGQHLVRALLDRKAQVTILVRKNTALPTDWPAIKSCPGDLQDPNSLKQACQGMEIVFHAAGFAHALESSAHSTALHWQINALGTRSLLEAIVTAGVTHLVFLSSIKAMGKTGKRCVDENWPALPETSYGTAKRAAEQWVLETGQSHDIHVVNLRLAMVYGPGSRGNLVRMAAAIRRGRFPPLPEVGNKRSMVHVEDVVQAALTAARHPAAKLNTYIVTDGCTYSTRQIYDWICQQSNKPIPSWAMPVTSLRVLAWLGDLLGLTLGKQIGFDSAVMDQLLGWACYDSGKIQRELGYRPHRTLQESLPKIIRESSEPGAAR